MLGHDLRQVVERVRVLAGLEQQDAADELGLRLLGSEAVGGTDQEEGLGGVDLLLGDGGGHAADRLLGVVGQAGRRGFGQDQPHAAGCRRLEIFSQLGERDEVVAIGIGRAGDARGQRLDQRGRRVSGGDRIDRQDGRRPQERPRAQCRARDRRAPAADWPGASGYKSSRTTLSLTGDCLRRRRESWSAARRSSWPGPWRNRAAQTSGGATASVSTRAATTTHNCPAFFVFASDSTSPCSRRTRLGSLTTMICSGGTA